jgi:predicted tellurium resistance membrane protein TerC
MDVHYLTNIIVSLFTLTLLELILGVDNLVFIAIASNRLHESEQKLARRFGLLLALVTRLLLLATVSYLSHLKVPFFTLFDISFSVSDLLLLGGGLFLIYKGTVQIHAETEPEPEPEPESEVALKKHYSKLIPVILQIGIIDIIFSFDSVFTAVGMTSLYWIMATAITITIIIMIFASEPLSRFIESRPTIKILALSFILLIGILLVADGMHYHVPRAYVYFAICYALFVEMLNSIVHNRKMKKLAENNKNA